MNKKIRVLEVVGRMDMAGQETFLMNIFRNADREKYDFYFSVNTDHIGAFENEILKLDGKIYHNPYYPDKRNLFKYLKSFRNFLKKEGPFDVIHCHVWLFSGFILKIAKKEKIPVRIMHSHNTNDGKKKSFFRRLYNWYAKKMIKNYSTNFVACGKEAYKALFNIECKNDDHILNNSIDLTLFNEKQYNLSAKKNELGVAENDKVFVSVARFFDVKNHVKIISTFNEYLTYNKNAILLLVGDGVLKQTIYNLVKEKGILNKVKFLGVRNDVNTILLCSDIFIMPSKFEGLPVSLVEAQAAGVHCVISDTITKEIDMGLDLISMLSINAPDNLWCKKFIDVSKVEKPAFIKRAKFIELNGYTIDATWRKLDLIYEHQS